jgi:hypothetical protein
MAISFTESPMASLPLMRMIALPASTKACGDSSTSPTFHQFVSWLLTA